MDPAHLTAGYFHKPDDERASGLVLNRVPHSMTTSSAIHNSGCFPITKGAGE